MTTLSSTSPRYLMQCRICRGVESFVVGDNTLDRERERIGESSWEDIDVLFSAIQRLYGKTFERSHRSDTPYPHLGVTDFIGVRQAKEAQNGMTMP